MAWSEHNADLDTGISYRASTPNLQKLLDKVRARKRAAGEGTSDRNGMIMNYRALSARLDDLIELEYAKGVLQSVWRKIKKPSFKTISKIRKGEGAAQREYERLTPHVEDIANQLRRFRFSFNPDSLIQFARKPLIASTKKNLKMFMPEGTRFSGTRSLLGIGAIGIGAGAAGVGAYHFLDKRRQRNEMREWLARNKSDRDRLVSGDPRYTSALTSVMRNQLPIDRRGLDKATIEQLNRQNLSAKLDDMIQFQDKEDFDYAYNHPTLKKRANKLWKSGKLPKGRYDHPEIDGMAWSLAYQHHIKRDSALSAKLDDLIEFADPRPRNNLGEFAPQQEGAPDPNAMYKTYRIAPAQPGVAPNKEGPGLGGLAALGLVGGAAGATGAEAAKGTGRALQTLARRLGYLKKGRK